MCVVSVCVNWPTQRRSPQTTASHLPPSLLTVWSVKLPGNRKPTYLRHNIGCPVLAVCIILDLMPRQMITEIIEFSHVWPPTKMSHVTCWHFVDCKSLQHSPKQQVSSGKSQTNVLLCIRQNILTLKHETKENKFEQNLVWKECTPTLSNSTH